MIKMSEYTGISANAVRKALSDQNGNRCCPGCHSKDRFTVIHGKVGENPHLPSYDTFECACGQVWHEGFRLVYYPVIRINEASADLDPSIIG